VAAVATIEHRSVSAPLPWLSEADLAECIRDFERGGFRGGFNRYRNLERNLDLLAPSANARIRQPAMRSAVEALATVLPGLRHTAILKGAGHRVQQEAPDDVNALLQFLGAL